MGKIHVTLVFVMSLDGKLTRGEDPNVHAWASPEDWEHFKSLRAKSDVIVLDRTTYEAVRPLPEPDKLRIVLTHHADLYRNMMVPGQLEFMSAKPLPLLEQLEAGGHQRVLLAGGGQVSSDFLKAGAVDDLYVTIEPMMFGRGTAMLAAKTIEVQLDLQSVRPLNKRGSLLVHYTVRKPQA